MQEILKKYCDVHGTQLQEKKRDTSFCKDTGSKKYLWVKLECPRFFCKVSSTIVYYYEQDKWWN